MTYENEMRKKAWEEHLEKVARLYCDSRTYEEFKAKKTAAQFDVTYFGIDLFAYYHFKRRYPGWHFFWHVVINASVCGILSGLAFCLLPMPFSAIATVCIILLFPLLAEAVWDTTIGWQCLTISCIERNHIGGSSSRR